MRGDDLPARRTPKPLASVDALLYRRRSDTCCLAGLCRHPLGLIENLRRPGRRGSSGVHPTNLGDDGNRRSAFPVHTGLVDLLDRRAHPAGVHSRGRQVCGGPGVRRPERGRGEGCRAGAGAPRERRDAAGAECARAKSWIAPELARWPQPAWPLRGMSRKAWSSTASRSQRLARLVDQRLRLAAAASGPIAGARAATASRRRSDSESASTQAEGTRAKMRWCRRKSSFS